MKTREYETKDGNKGVQYVPEPGDLVTSRFSSVYENKGGKFTNYVLGVTLEDGKEVTIKITEGQKKALERTGDLMGKVIEFEKYTHETFGDLVGARVKKE